MALREKCKRINNAVNISMPTQTLRETRMVLIEKLTYGRRPQYWVLANLDVSIAYAKMNNRTSIEIPTFWLCIKGTVDALENNGYKIIDYDANKLHTSIVLFPKAGINVNDSNEGKS